MKRLLRSVIDFGGTDSDNLLLNLQKLVTARIEWPQPVDDRIFKYLVSYFQQRMEPPAAQTVRDYFDQSDDIEAMERLKDIEAAPVYIRTNYTHLLNNLTEEQNRIRAIAVLKETHEILSKGLLIDGERLHGVRAGLQHFTKRTAELVVPEGNAKIRGEIRSEGQAVWDEYVEAKINKDKAWGKFTGLNHIDKAIHGIRKGELWLHAGYVGELKSTFAVNWCYNLVTRYRSNVLYISLEMPHEQVRRYVYCIHSAHAKWRAQGYEPLDYGKIRDGELTPEEEAFYQKVIEDFSTNPEYCRFEIFSPDEEVSIDDVRLEAELLHKRLEIGLVVIDHGQLMDARKKKRSKDFIIEQNSIIRDTKMFALHFNHREGIPVLLLYPINRQGKEDADKNEGEYKLKALSYANEAERSADYVTTSYLNKEHRDAGTVVFCNLKNREGKQFEKFNARINFSCRRIYNHENYNGAEGKGMSVDDHGSVFDVMSFI